VNIWFARKKKYYKNCVIFVSQVTTMKVYKKVIHVLEKLKILNKELLYLFY
jgi:hypothetical protein